MTSEKDRALAPDEHECDTESMDLFITETLAESLPPPSDRDQGSSTELLKEDREAMDAMGGSPELVSQIIASCKTRNPLPHSLQPTLVDMSSTTDTRVSDRPVHSESTQEFERLLEHLEEFRQYDRLSWSHDYSKKKEIGRGGQGVVYLTECLNQHHLPKALKIFSPEPYGNVESYYEDMQRMEEVSSLVYSMQVDNLVMVEQFAFNKGICMMIMRWIDGCDLATLVKPCIQEKLEYYLDQDRLHHLNDAVITTRGTVQARLKPGMAVNVIEKCLRALDALHSQGIVHGDIKPANIMLDRYGSIRMVDIGSAFQQSAQPRRHFWTPRYAPPEIFEENGEWTPQGDFASLGYVLIEMLSGQPAIPGPDIESAGTRLLGAEWDRHMLVEKLQLPERLCELLPPDVQESDHLMNMLQRLIAPEPEDRFQNAEEALIGPSGTYQYFQDLARINLAAPFSQEIKHWITDVMKFADT